MLPVHWTIQNERIFLIKIVCPTVQLPFVLKGNDYLIVHKIATVRRNVPTSIRCLTAEKCFLNEDPDGKTEYQNILPQHVGSSQIESQPGQR